MTKMKTIFKKYFQLKYFVLLCCIEFAFAAHAQNIQTDKIQWNATGFTDLNHNTVVNNAPCQFISTGNQIDWVQGDGSYVNSFAVLTTSGTWPDLSKSGSIILSVKADVLTGDITLSRDSNGITIKLVLAGGTNPINIVYAISMIEKL